MTQTTLSAAESSEEWFPIYAVSREDRVFVHPFAANWQHRELTLVCTKLLCSALQENC